MWTQHCMGWGFVQVALGTGEVESGWSRSRGRSTGTAAVAGGAGEQARGTGQELAGREEKGQAGGAHCGGAGAWAGVEPGVRREAEGRRMERVLGELLVVGRACIIVSVARRGLSYPTQV